ncbi:hypothetical protein D6792_02430 [Candidatus Parcubacteria bacterium]|jgi:hypothetical protein|nr:MAG: hypothetical protein D6792_02430 [Candidatus Parcubacteria bacterium]GIW69152.1 MAG: hypothetical protein KatS3mg100_646 [Candidatus Parcubacteria bacterium]
MPKQNNTSTGDNKMSAAKQGGIVAGLSAMAAVGAAAAYFLYGSKHAKKNRAKVRGWMVKAKGEVIEKLEKAKEVNKEVVSAIVDQVLARYAKVKDIGEEEARRLAEELKRQWQAAERDLARVAQKGKKAVKRATHKVSIKKEKRADN